MTKFIFEGVDSVKDAILEMDIPNLRRQVRMGEYGGIMHLVHGDQVAEQTEALLGYIDSAELKRDLEGMYEENGKIDFTTLPDVPMDGGLMPGYFAAKTVLVRLYAASQRRQESHAPNPRNRRRVRN